jgi:cytidylate kinase
MIIAIDGPAAAGKGTLARRLAAALTLPYLDTGQLYRAVGRLVLDEAADPADPQAATAAAEHLRAADLARPDLRDATASKAASQVASIPGVRAALLAFQRNFGDTHGAVLDGRDIGTIIFPRADIKLFVTATPQARAQRRLAEFLAKGENVSFEDVLADLTARDEADKNRTAAPLIPAPDAILLDTSHMDADAAFQAALAHIRQKHPTP